MSQTVLDSIALGYQPVWGRDRQLAAVRLRVKTVHPDAVDAEHLMQALGDDWPVHAPPLVLSMESRTLLRQALACEPVQNTWLEVPQKQVQDAEGSSLLREAQTRGHELLRRADLADLRGETEAPLGVRSLLQLDATEAYQVLQGAREAGATEGLALLPAGQIYGGLGSQALADACLDAGRAWGVLGWPDEDVLHTWRHRAVACEAAVIRQVLAAIERDSAIDQIERVVRQDPVLAYRLLAMVSRSPAAQRHEIGSLRHAILMLGFTALQQWLGEQALDRANDPPLHPVRYGMAMRARLAQHLLEPGSDSNLRSEVYATALFAQIDRLEHLPLADLLTPLTLSSRVQQALLSRSGAYHAYLEVSAAQANAEHLDQLPAICHRHGMSLEDANRALVRMLATSREIGATAARETASAGH